MRSRNYHHIRGFATLFAVGVVAAGGQAQQCDGEWLPGQGVAGVFGDVIAATAWEGGRGGHGPVLVVGGQFEIAGHVTARFVASWDGVAWAALGSGLNGAAYALTTYDGDLIVGGAFTMAGDVSANNIARWDGAAWHPLGDGMPEVQALTVWNGELIAGGAGVSRWNGTNWLPLGAGPPPAAAFTQFDGELLAAGHSGVWRFDEVGGSWEPFGSATGQFGALAVYNGELVAGGRFWDAGGKVVRHVARWDAMSQSWQPLGATFDPPWSAVSTLSVHEGSLIAGGMFEIAGEAAARKIAVWDGAAWRALGAGRANTVLTTATYAGALVAGSQMWSSHDYSISLWDPVNESWLALGMGLGPHPRILALTEHEGELIAGGFFNVEAEATAAGIARWDTAAQGWRRVGSGLGPANDSLVDALIVYNGDLIAAGDFTTAGDIVVNCIARWDGSSWHPLGSGFAGVEPLGVRSMAVYEGDLIAGGSFMTAGGITARNIARWDGLSWHPLGNPCCSVRALLVYDGELIAGGSGVQRWDGAAWEPLGEAPSSGWVATLAEFNGDLIATGSFTTAGGARNIARWDGKTWHPLGNGLGLPDEAASQGIALAVYNDELVVGGSFLLAGGVTARSIARWNGSTWRPLGYGATMGGWFGGWVCALMPHNDELIAGGWFTQAGEAMAVSLARWRAAGPTGDLNGDGVVDVFGLLILLGAWGDCPSAEPEVGGLCPADLDGDGVVNVFDLLILLAGWG
jgi:hypothetical protein